MVLSFFRFPSMETYRQYFAVRRSFRASLPEEFSKEMMDAHIEKRGDPSSAAAGCRPA